VVETARKRQKGGENELSREKLTSIRRGKLEDEKKGKIQIGA